MAYVYRQSNQIKGSDLNIVSFLLIKLGVCQLFVKRKTENDTEIPYERQLVGRYGKIASLITARN